MDDAKIRLYKNMSFVMFGIVAVLVFLIYFVTYIHQDVTSANPFIFLMVKYHLGITVGLILVSAISGYISSSITYKQLNRTRTESRKLLDTLFLFLNIEEREIIDHLVKLDGVSTQAEISRLPSMNRVKAFRSLQKILKTMKIFWTSALVNICSASLWRDG